MSDELKRDNDISSAHNACMFRDECRANVRSIDKLEEQLRKFASAIMVGRDTESGLRAEVAALKATNDMRANRLTDLTQERDALQEQLRVARCPNLSCSSGVIYSRVGDPEECEWCAVRRAAIPPESK